MKGLKLTLFASMLMVGTMFVPQMKAGQFDKLTKMTFNNPVEVPGRVLAPRHLRVRAAGFRVRP